jgi:hypothetical protein
MVLVCSSCSGLHRDINHRVKGVGMTVFKPEELEALSKKGNEVSLLKLTPRTFLMS